MYGDYDPVPVGEEYEGAIVQPIPDNLMVGDYIEINGICRGPEVIVELITEEQQRGMRNDVLPLHIRMLAGGPVLVKNYSKDKVEQKECNHRMPIQQNQSFELCIYALEEGYEIKLNGQTVCKHKHVVNLEDVSAITMDGDADFTSIEFKDTSGEGADSVYEGETPQAGFMRVQEMRESFSRKPGQPQIIRSSVRRSNRSNQMDHPSSEWKTSSDLSRPNIDIDTSARHTMAAPGYGVTADLSPKTKKRSSVLPQRKSIHLDEAKLDDYAVVGGSQSRAIAGDAHRGEYRLLDDEARPITRQVSQNIYESGNMSTSAVSLQEKKKKRGSLFGSRSRKSKGSESDLSMGTEKEKKIRGSRGLLRSKKGATVSENDLRTAGSIADTNFASSGSVFVPSSTMSLRPNYFGVGTDRAPVPGPVPKSVAKLSAAEMAGYMAGQKAVPDFESFTLTNGEDPELHQLSRARITSATYADEQQVAPVSRSMYEPPMSAAVVQPRMKEPQGPLYLGVGADRAPVPGPVPKSVLKQSAPEIAGYVAGQRAIPEFEDFNYVGPIVAESRQSMQPEVYTSQQAATSRTSMMGSRELKGTSPEKADILFESGRAGFDPNVNLTGGKLDSTYIAPGVGATYGVADPRGVTQPPPLKGTAPEMASTIQGYYRNVSPGDSTMLDPRTANFKPEITTVGQQSYPSVPTKLKGPAPEMAAQLEDAYHGRMRAFPETTLAGDVSTQRPKSVGRPTYDIDPVISKPKYTEPSRPAYDIDRVTTETIRPVERSSSVPYQNSYRDDDTESLVHSENEYIYVSRSDYFLDRQRSLKNYKSKRSRDKEREARRSMGLSTRTDSARSSISSLTEEDFRKGRVIIAQKGRTEPPVYQTRAMNTKVYAAPPLIEPKLQRQTKTEMDSIKLKNGEFATKIPLTLIPGRSAHLAGHFLQDLPQKQSCIVRLWTDELTNPNEFSAVTLELSSSGELTIHGTKNTNPTCLLNWQGEHVGNNLMDSRMFNITLHARSGSSAITINEFITLWLPENFDPVKLNHLQLENSNNAQLDYFAVTTSLALPVDLVFPVQSHRDETQTLRLETEMTADTKIASAEFVTQTNKSFTVMFDFDRNCVYASSDANQSKPINFVPEQIREIEIKRCMTKNRISVTANGKELLDQMLTLTRPVGKLSRVRINGQFTLLNAELY